MSFPFRLIKLLIIMFLLNIISNADIVQAQNSNFKNFQYISPVPFSKLNSTETNIIIRFGDAFDQSILNSSSSLSVRGSKSGDHTGKLILAESGRTLIFNPDKPFEDGEKVEIKLGESIKTVLGKKIPELKYSFETSRVNLNKKVKYDLGKYSGLLYPYTGSQEKGNSQKINSLNNFLQRRYTIQPDSLPGNFPKYIVDSINNPSPGYFFFTPFEGSYPTYLIITDNFGIPIFYHKVKGRTFDFKKQPTGVLTYFEEGLDRFYVLDSSYNVVDTLFMKNGYSTNFHDLQILENGHVLMMCFDEQEVAMDTVVENGNPNAAVIGLVIQEQDENKNVVFQWRSWDHFKITDATYDISLTDSIIDYVHGNAIEVDNDGNILLSCRHMDLVTKIDRETGEIIWRWGGTYCKNNEFTFTNDAIGFSHQHDIRRLANGNLSLFDNGNLHNPQFSRAVEYQLDEVNKTATLVWEYKNNPETYDLAMGSVQRLNNSHTIIGWGIDYSNKSPAISEVLEDGVVAFYLTLPEINWSYRAFKFPWKTNLFVANPDSLFFGNVAIGDSVIKFLVINNNSNQEIKINGLLNRNPSYKTNISLPLTIPAFDTATVQVIFKPETEGDYNDDLHLQWNKENERIAQVVPMIGTANPILPVELISFTALVSDKNVTLNWTTATEINNLGFEIERKSNGIKWVTIGFVKGMGTTTETNGYTFADDMVGPGKYSYRLKQINFQGSFEYSDIVDVDVKIPLEFSLDQNYPNPFNPSTKISFSTPERGRVLLKIYDILGRKIKTLINKVMNSGNHEVSFEAKNLPSGVYFYSLRVNGYKDTKKMILLQ